jgi:hypothetical protein
MKIVAAKRDTSTSALLTATLSDLADQEEGYTVARVSRCSILWSEDLSSGQQWGNVEVRNPF